MLIIACLSQRQASGASLPDPQPDLRYQRFADVCEAEATRGDLVLNLAAGTQRCFINDADEWVRTATRVRGPHGEIPLLVRMPPRGRPITRIVVELVGGPHGHIEPDTGSPVQRLQRAMVDRGAVVISVGYLGTQSRTLYPGSDIAAAIDEVVFYVEFLRRRHPELPMTVLGKSAGGYLLAAASERLSSCHCVYLSPLLGTPNDGQRRFQRLFTRRLGPDGWTKAYNEPIYAHIWSDRGPRSRFASARQLTRGEAVTNFFRGFGDTDFAKLAFRNARGCSHLVYGLQDPRIGIERVGTLPQSERIRVTGIAGYDHQFGPDSSSEMAARAVTRAVFESCEA